MKQIPLKQWKIEEAERIGITLMAFEAKLYRGKIPMPPIHRVNSRVINVIVQ